MRDIATDRSTTRTPRSVLPTPTEDELRVVAIKRVKAKRGFRTHLFVYLVVNIGLWSVWVVDGIANRWEFPWPLFPTVFWGVFVLAQWIDVYRRDALHEDLVQKEIEQLRAASTIHPLDTYVLDDDD